MTTDNGFPFDPDVEEVVAERNNRRLLAIVAGVGALALLAFFVVLPALSGDDAEEAPTAVRRRPRAVASPTASPTPRVPVPITETFNDTVGRDPFRPLFAEPVSGGGGGALPGTGGGGTQPGTGGGTGGTGGGTTQPGSGGTPAPGTGGGGGTGTDQPAGGSTQVGGNRVSLVDVFVRDGRTYAQTRVGSTVHTPAVGETFAQNYQLLSASGECATFLYGDESFQLCEGQEVLK